MSGFWCGDCFFRSSPLLPSSPPLPPSFKTKDGWTPSHNKGSEPGGKTDFVSSPPQPPLLFFPLQLAGRRVRKGPLTLHSEVWRVWMTRECSSTLVSGRQRWSGSFCSLEKGPPKFFPPCSSSTSPQCTERKCFLPGVWKFRFPPRRPPRNCMEKERVFFNRLAVYPPISSPFFPPSSSSDLFGSFQGRGNVSFAPLHPSLFNRSTAVGLSFLPSSHFSRWMIDPPNFPPTSCSLQG